MNRATDPYYRDFAGTLRHLGDPEAKPTPGEVHQLSGASAADVAAWREIWPAIAPERRRQIVRQLSETAEADFQLDFRPLFATLIDDADPEVRATAIDGLWEATDLGLIDRFAERLRRDPDDRVRARAAAALGVFVERGELEDRCAERVAAALDLLAQVGADEGEAVEVRRRAIESAGFADRPDVHLLIERAIDAPEQALRAGALRAMGHSADPAWGPDVLAWLDHPEPELRFEAARAAGDLSLAAAVPQLAELIEDDSDPAVQIEAIWALGEIGGRRAVLALERLAAGERADLSDEIASAIEDALSTAALADGTLAFSGLSARARQSAERGRRNGERGGGLDNAANLYGGDEDALDEDWDGEDWDDEDWNGEGGNDEGDEDWDDEDLDEDWPEEDDLDADDERANGAGL